MSPVVISPFTFRNLLIYVCVALVLSAFVAYVVFQARFLIAGPQISLSTNASELQTQRQVVLEGEAQNIVRITLNGRQIYTDKDGNFKEALVLENGYTIATLQAEDRYGRTTSLTKTFVFAQEEEVDAGTES